MMDKKSNIKLVFSALVLLAILVGIGYAVSMAVTSSSTGAVSDYIIKDWAVLNFSINNTATAADNITNITIDITANLTFVSGSNATNGTNTANFANSGNILYWNVTDNSSFSPETIAWFAFNVTPKGAIEYANVSINITVWNLSGSTSSQVITSYWVDNRSPHVSLATTNLTNSSTNVSVLLNFSVSDILNDSCSLYVNDSSWSAKSNGTANALNNVGFTYNFSGEGTYLWNIWCNDSAGNSAFNATNYTIVIDMTAPTTAPNITAVNDSNKDGNINITWTADPSAMMYGVFWATSNLTNATTATRLANVTITYFVDNTTTHGQTRWYGVTSIDYAGNENLSVINTTTGAFLNGTANDTIAPKMTQNINETQSGNTATISWNYVTQDGSGNADEYAMRYLVYTSTSINTSKSPINKSDFTLQANITTNTTTYSISSTHRRFFVVVTADDAGNENLTLDTSKNYLNVSLTYTADDDGDGSSSSGGGGGGGTATASAGVSDSKMWGVLPKGITVMDVKASKSAIAIRGLTLNMKNQISNAEVTVTKLDAKPSSLTKATGETYQYLKIDKKVIKDADFENVKIKFRVTKSWLTVEGINEGDVVLYKYTTKWIKLSTKKISSDATYATYEATTSGFSYFAISGKKAGIKTATLTGEDGVIEGEEGEGVEESAAGEAEEKEPGKRKSWLGWIIVSSVIVVGLVIYFILISKKKKDEGQGFPPEQPQQPPQSHQPQQPNV